MSLEADIIVFALSKLASSRYRLLKSQDSSVQDHVADLESIINHSSVLAPPSPPASPAIVQQNLLIEPKQKH